MSSLDSRAGFIVTLCMYMKMFTFFWLLVAYHSPASLICIEMCYFHFFSSSPSSNRDCKDVVCFDAENFNFLAQKLQLDLHEPPVQQVSEQQIVSITSLTKWCKEIIVILSSTLEREDECHYF